MSGNLQSVLDRVPSAPARLLSSQGVLAKVINYFNMTAPLVVGSIVGSSVLAYLVFDLISHR